MIDLERIKRDKHLALTDFDVLGCELMKLKAIGEIITDTTGDLPWKDGEFKLGLGYLIIDTVKAIEDALAILDNRLSGNLKVAVNGD